MIVLIMKMIKRVMRRRMMMDLNKDNTLISSILGAPS